MADPADEVPWPELARWLTLTQLRGIACAWCMHWHQAEEAEALGVSDGLWICADRVQCEARWEARGDLLADRIRQYLS